MLKSVSTSSTLLYHIFLLCFKANIPRIPVQSCWGDTGLSLDLCWCITSAAPISSVTPRFPRESSDYRCLCRPSAARNLWRNCKAPGRPFQPFHPGKKNHWGKGSSVLLSFPQVSHGWQKRKTQPCEIFGACLVHTTLGFSNCDLKDTQIGQTDIKI